MPFVGIKGHTPTFTATFGRDHEGPFVEIEGSCDGCDWSVDRHRKQTHFVPDNKMAEEGTLMMMADFKAAHEGVS